MRTAYCRRRPLGPLMAINLGIVFALAACGLGPDGTTAGTATTPTDIDTEPDVADETDHDDDAVDDDLLDLTRDPAAFDRLVAAAQDEGEVVWYTSLESQVADDVAALFEAEYGIGVIVQRSGGAEILQRFLLEADSGRIQNDVLGFGADPGTITALMEDGYFECFKPRQFDELHEWAQSADECWTASRGTAMVIGYRTDLIAEMGVDPPASWQDMARPEFRGRVGSPNPNFSNSVKQAVTLLSEEIGWDWFRDLRDNDLMVVRGNGPLMEALEVGEIVVGGPSTNPRLVEAKLSGLPIDFVYPEEGTIIGASPHVVVQGAANPHAGRLLVDFLLTEEVQEVMLERGDYVGHAAFPPAEGLLPISEITTFAIDHVWINANSDERAAQFTELFEAEADDG